MGQICIMKRKMPKYEINVQSMKRLASGISFHKTVLCKLNLIGACNQNELKKEGSREN